jgi:FMN phosphatase YigB (HAD superfamily)
MAERERREVPALDRERLPRLNAHSANEPKVLPPVPFKAVLFDWRGTLAFTPSEREWVRLALARLRRDEAAAGQVWAAIAGAANVGLLEADDADADAAVHRSNYFAVFRAAGLDEALATTLYDLEGDLSLNPFAADVAETLQAVRARGLKVAVISDIHFDLRPAFAAAGLADHIDAYVLSYEEGAQKPATAMFTAALERLEVRPGEALMVGDRSRYDGAAVELGILTLLLPPLRSPGDRRLHHVTALLG